MNRRVAITPIQLDLTASRLLARLGTWPWDMPAVDVPAAAEPGSVTEAILDETVTAQADPKAERR